MIFKIVHRVPLLPVRIPHAYCKLFCLPTLVESRCGPSRLKIILNSRHLSQSETGSRLYDLSSEERRRQFLAVVRKFDILEKDIAMYPSLLEIRPVTLDHRGMVLQEGGFKRITVALLISYLHVIKKSISVLKAHDLINQKTDVAESFLSHIGHPPLKLSAQDTDDSKSFSDVYGRILKEFLMWRLEMSSDQFDYVMKTYRRIKHKSLRYIFQTLDILENDFGFTKEKIRKNGYLIHSHPHNSLDMLKRCPTLGGLDVKVVVQKHPKILMANTDTLIRTSQFLKDYNIADIAIQRCLDIFTLSSESVRHRLEDLMREPSFKAMVNHPRILRLVHYHGKVQSRLQSLEDLKMNCASLHMLSTTDGIFERFAQEGEDRTRGCDMVFYLSEYLGATVQQLRKVLSRHPYWNSVPLPAVQRTLEFLLAQGFSPEDVLPNVHIMLYPRELVEQELKSLGERLEVVEAVQQAGIERQLSPRHQLALCLYFLEREHHFTGGGVWNSSKEIADRIDVADELNKM